jgi:23S rRNA (guanosine2251-2'-O)-methyltransferase
MSTDVVAGINAVESALRNDPARVIEVVVEQGAQNHRVRDLTSEAKGLGIAVWARPRDALDKMAPGMRHQGVVARYRRATALSEDDLAGLVEAAGPGALVLVLDGVQDPHNLGACLRSAEAAAVTAVVVPRDRAADITPVVHKASAGAADRVPLVRVTNLARAMDVLKKTGVWITGLAGDSDASLYATDLKGPVALAVGGEADGLRRLTRERCDFLAKIPMRGGVESLNVSVATGIALFEVLRQRGGA